MGIYKAKPYYQGGWEKYRKINSSRIIGQGKNSMLCPINHVRGVEICGLKFWNG
jgi:hypothetical protein